MKFSMARSHRTIISMCLEACAIHIIVLETKISLVQEAAVAFLLVILLAKKDGKFSI